MGIQLAKETAHMLISPSLTYKIDMATHWKRLKVASIHGQHLPATSQLSVEVD
jgi:hypothetical protein